MLRPLLNSEITNTNGAMKRCHRPTQKPALRGYSRQVWFWSIRVFGSPYHSKCPRASFRPTSCWQTANPQALVGISEVFFSRRQIVNSSESLFSSSEALPALHRSQWNSCPLPMYQGALTVKMRSLPRARSTHSRSCLLYTSDAADEEDSVDL